MDERQSSFLATMGQVKTTEGYVDLGTVDMSIPLQTLFDECMSFISVEALLV